MKRIFTDHTGEPRQFFSPDEVAKQLGVHPMTIRRKIQKGELTAFSVAGSTLRIAADEIERFLSSRTVGRKVT